MGFFDKKRNSSQESIAAAHSENETPGTASVMPPVQFAGGKIRNKRKKSADKNRLGKTARLKERLPFYGKYYKGLLDEHDQDVKNELVDHEIEGTGRDLANNVEMLLNGTHYGQSDDVKEDRYRRLNELGMHPDEIEQIVDLPKAQYSEALVNWRGEHIIHKPLPTNPDEEN